ncbi:regulatory protein RecX [[Flexibacter] sp. ATCC 35208]|uniref:regulatory protein RecX n=1 Tax=[Flexibacter] sp. ATCC 35208 TaxID=1936242 RepID=UPI0009CE16F8|nr:regulatory protein RecX [[Flexibacter] sp. ATCC 35208]OMP77772.1 RecX family transcriptional regulator [[Flexibacter] sp. ATCC 35208]
MQTAILLKLRHYCAYQERSHSEVKTKCLELGLRGDEIEEAIAALIADNFLNEERFARAYAGGKFRSQKWGRKKILAGLRQHQVSAYCIKKGMEEIDDEDYMDVLQSLVEKKYASLEGEQYLKRQYKTTQYLLQKGFEPELVSETLRQIAKDGL